MLIMQTDRRRSFRRRFYDAVGHPGRGIDIKDIDAGAEGEANGKRNTRRKRSIGSSPRSPTQSDGRSARIAIAVAAGLISRDWKHGRTFHPDRRR